MSNTLKKEFSKRDVQRMRNLITGKTNDATRVQSGWERHRPDRKEGDIWEESGKTGSDIENQANALAGVLMREYGAMHKIIYENKK